MNNTITQRTEYVRTEQGTDVFVIQTPSKDVVVCTMAFPGAGLHAAYSKQSIVRLLSELLPSGTKKHTKNYILEKFELLGASVSVSHGGGYVCITLASRSAFFLEAFELLLLVLTDAVFSKSEYASALSSVENSCIHAEEDTKIRAVVALRQAMYRKGHPHWAPTPQQLLSELKSTTREEVLGFHKDTLSAVGSVVCIAGDVQPKKIVQALQRSLTTLPSTLPKEYVQLHVGNTNNSADDTQILSIQNKFNVDTFVGIPLALTRDDEDFQALQVGVSILGGTSSSRLFSILRTKKNLTYGSYAQLDGFSDGYPGFLSARAIFPNDVFLIGKPVLEETIQTFVEKGVTPKEVQERKEEIVGKFKVGLSTTAGMCSALFATVMSGKPLSYIDEYPQKISELGTSIINKAIRKHINFALAKTTAGGAIDKEGKPL